MLFFLLIYKVYIESSFCVFPIMQVLETRGKDILCLVKNSATLLGSIFTMHASQVHIDLPTLTDVDRQVTRWLMVS